MTRRFCLGFAFSPEEDYSVLLVQKTKGYHIGCLNGLGGVVKPGESPAEGMAREFREESGYDIPVEGWHEGAILLAAVPPGSPFGTAPAWSMSVFRARLPVPYLPLPDVDEAGPLKLMWLGDLHPRHKFAPYVRSFVWLLQEQFEQGLEHTAILYAQEHRP